MMSGYPTSSDTVKPANEAPPASNEQQWEILLRVEMIEEEKRPTAERV